MTNCIVVNIERLKSCLLGFYEGLLNILEDSIAELERPLLENELLNALKGIESGKLLAWMDSKLSFMKSFGLCLVSPE